MFSPADGSYFIPPIKDTIQIAQRDLKDLEEAIARSSFADNHEIQLHIKVGMTSIERRPKYWDSLEEPVLQLVKTWPGFNRPNHSNWSVIQMPQQSGSTLIEREYVYKTIDEGIAAFAALLPPIKRFEEDRYGQDRYDECMRNREERTAILRARNRKVLPELGPQWKKCTVEDIDAIMHGDKARYDQIMNQ